MTTVRGADARNGGAAAPSGGGALAELLEVEERVAAEIAEAEAQAERIVAEARRRAQAETDGLDDAFAKEAAALRASIEAESDARLRSITESAAAETAFHHEVDDATVERIARRIVSLVLGGSEAP